MQPGPGSQSSSDSESEASGICVAASLVAGLLAAFDMAAIDGQPLKYVSGCYLLVNCLHLGDSLLTDTQSRVARLLAACKGTSKHAGRQDGARAAGAAILPINDIISA